MIRYKPKFLVCFLLLLNFQVQANNYYVSNEGNDNNTGTSLANAFLTLQQAADIVTAGDSVLVADGSYVGFDLRDKNGTASANIVFKSINNEVFILQHGPIRNDGINIENADYIVIDGLNVDGMPGNGNGIRVVLSDNCIIRNCTCDHNAERGIFTAFSDDILIEYNVCRYSVDEHGIYVSNSSDRPVIRYNWCVENNNIGIHLNGDLSEGGDGIISDAQIYGNVILDNKLAAGINMDGVENAIIYNNVIVNNHSGQGIALFQQDGAVVSSGAKIYNNTIVVPNDGRWGILLKEGANIHTEIYNNIIVNQHDWRGCIAAESTAQLKSDYNILNDKMSNDGDGTSISLADWQNSGFDNHSLLAQNPNQIFAIFEEYNFHLLVGSQAVDAGTSLVADIVTTDIEATPRPYGNAFDIGAYEFSLTDAVENISFDALKIFPNPTHGYFLLENNNQKVKIKKIDLIDLRGKWIRSFGLEESFYDLQRVPAGIFLLRIILENDKLVFRKIIVI